MFAVKSQEGAETLILDFEIRVRSGGIDRKEKKNHIIGDINLWKKGKQSMTNVALRERPDAGNLHVRFDEGDVAPAVIPRCGPLHMGSKAIVLVVSAVCGVFSLSAAPLYTNQWVGGVSGVASWGDAANWTVSYADGTPAPTSAVPTAASLTMIRKTADIILPPGSFASGSTYFLAKDSDKILNLEILSGARLALEGADEVSYLGTAAWQDGPVNNKITLDINGGELAVSQKLLALHPNTKPFSECTAYNRIQVRNGGLLSLSGDARLRLWGGESAYSTGAGVYTNIVDILPGGTLELRDNAALVMGGDIDSTPLHVNQPYMGAGWVNVRGGTMRVHDASTFTAPLYMATHPNAGVGAYLTVSEGGTVDLGGKELYIQARNTNVIRVASGSVVSNFNLAVEQGNGTDVRYHNLVDIDGGTVWMEDCKLISDDTARGTNARLTLRVRGGGGLVSVDRWYFAPNYENGGVPPLFNDFRLTAHTDRDADFAVRPIRTRLQVWDGTKGGVVNKTIPGIWRLSPDGGFQLVRRDSFELLCRNHDGQGYHVASKTYGGFIGEEMWQTNTATLNEPRWKRYVGYEYAYVFRVSLKDEARLEDGVPLAAARPRAWLPLPSFTARQLDTNRTERISVRLMLEPPANGTLDLDAVVKGMRGAGHAGACADNAVAGYNVRVDLPLDELEADATDTRAILDFVSCETYGQACGAQPMTTNALIRAATCEYVKRMNGTVIIFR